MSDFSLGVSEDRVISQFSDWLYSTPFRPQHSINITADGKIHRYPIERDKGGATSGAYTLYMDGCPAGFAMDWHDSSTKITWKYDFSDEERREFGRLQHNSASRAKYENERKEAERHKIEDSKLQIEKQQQTLRMAIAEYLYADLFGTFKHPYLKERFTDLGIHIEHSSVFDSWDVRTNDEPQNYHPTQRFPIAISRGRVGGGLCKEGELLIPMLDVVSGKFQSLIHIPPTPNREGKFLKLNYPGLTPTGAAHALTPKFSEYAGSLFVCEGLCTGIAVLIDTQENFPIYSAGSCGNLLPVCRGLRTKYPDKKIIVVADNDDNGAGRKAADECRNARLADGIRMPEIAGHDWYDDLLMRRKGR